MLSRTIWIIAACLFAADVAMSATVQSFVSVSGPGLSSYIAQNSDIYSDDEGNDNPAANGLSWNSVEYWLYFSSTAHVDLVLQVASAPGDALVSEYDFIGLHRNDTPDNWTHGRIDLGFYDGGTFVPTSGDGLDFDHPDPATYLNSTRFPQATRSTSSIVFEGSTLEPGNTDRASYSIDIPGRDAVPAYAHTPTGYQFVVRITPTAHLPEPGMLSLIAAPMLAILRRR
jgi:hypothetical protein